MSIMFRYIQEARSRLDLFFKKSSETGTRGYILRLVSEELLIADITGGVDRLMSEDFGGLSGGS